MKQITKSNLEAVVLRINELTNSPETPYTVDAKGKYKANIGNYHLDWAYGGVKLVRMGNEGGGISDVLHSGYATKRELYNLMHSFIRGLELANEV